ncbi:AbrB-like transcriptional regulator involved in photosynthesis regulation [Synechococcus sp. A18-25c]|uniref:AbrB family transcriptional regulator n=1 Tax=unclassified Synechococcus TaxID=2626047 RepID=UPI000C4F74F5|nr:MULTISPECIES: AbrB family transcriptional regulator [unclassified Synechococcus]MAN19584.1 AbrB family transcriptional regulator [Synechococcus sp. EAC657]QNI48069.1 AbrB-like transcriptional regulator involved in photosynthesis regulation [Synechococcus sp. A15-60]QNJ19698.1 AbrB-like transcriptional regulator involved in photosynthesis regulation [Synechococcus sp. A18-25c]|tara:strand:- start:687 stop:1064 length:378 start_codon:yes stop_codon:yes gene_type:complete
MLTGAELLAKVKDLGDVSKTDLATACGYVSKKKDGSDRVNFTAFYEALLNAKGVDLGGGSAGVGKGGRKLSYKAVVQGNGNLLVGKAYTAMLDLQPGDEFTIKLSKKKGVTLVPMGAEDEEGSED